MNKQNMGLNRQEINEMLRFQESLLRLVVNNKPASASPSAAVDAPQKKSPAADRIADMAKHLAGAS